MILLIIDTQRGIVTDGIYNVKTFVQNVKALIDRARQNGVEVIYVRHNDGPGEELSPGNPAFEIYDEIAPTEHERIFDKEYNSAFVKTGLLEYLEEIQEQVIMVAGLQTDYCMDASVKGGFEHGLSMIVPKEANSTEDNDFMSGEASYHYYNDYMWNGRYAKSVTMQEALELLDKGR